MNSPAGSRRTLDRYDGKRVSVIFQLAGRRRAFCGPAAYEYDALLGNVLKVHVEGDCPEEDAELLIAEAEWGGRVVPDGEFGCDYCFQTT